MTSGYHGEGAIDRQLVTVGALLAAAAVTLGAFGAHALKGRVGAEALGWWHTAVEYQIWHAPAVVGGWAALAWSVRPTSRD